MKSNKKQKLLVKNQSLYGMRLKNVHKTTVSGQRISLKSYLFEPDEPQSSSYISLPREVTNNMARSKDKKRESESGEANDTKDESRMEEPTLDYDELVKRVCAIANPLAGRKLTKRLYKTVKRGKRHV